MSETPAPTIIESLGLTAEQETQRVAAEQWVNDAYITYAHEDKALTYDGSEIAKMFDRTGGSLPLFPYVYVPPTVDHAGPLSPEDKAKIVDDKFAKSEQIVHVMDGKDQNDHGLLGEKTTLEGLNPDYNTYEGHTDSDKFATIESVLHATEQYAPLQEQRMATIQEGQPDPLRDQMRQKFGI